MSVFRFCARGGTRIAGRLGGTRVAGGGTSLTRGGTSLPAAAYICMEGSSGVLASESTGDCMSEDGSE